MSISDIPPESLSLLMNKHPLNQSDEDADKITAVLRAHRAQVVADPKKAAASAKTRANDSLTIDDLDL